MSRLIVVSNRVTVPTKRQQANAGGLAVAIHAALRRYHGIWFGWSGDVVDAPAVRAEVARAGAATIATIDLSHDDLDEYYNGFANRTLWPLFHYRTDLTAYDRQFDKGYYRVNARFAHALAPMIERDDLIWVHDYHLIACGAELRRMDISNRIGFFLHIPFPSPEVLMTLPNHQALVRAMFAYDLVGFQTERDKRAFRDYVVNEAGGAAANDEWLTCFGRTVRVSAFPIGIDAKEFEQMAESAEARRHLDRMADSRKNRRLVIGVDRLDYTKGLPERFDAYERLLERYPENRGAVLMLQVAPPSRVGVQEYADLRANLEARSGHINGSYADFDWVPVRYVNRGYNRRALAGLYRASRVGLVTPLRDGMNLVAKEYVVAQEESDPGVLVLSRFAGAAQQLEQALLVNPHDIDGVVEALQRALTMPVAERRRRWRALRDNIFDEDVYAWRDHFVDALRDIPQAA
ncbi:MAG: alpha,alpha-trehalose-phosphate synthase (UDP-forming) [Alphaproteobacteria bacterium]